jgi:hypothetical protein
LCDDGCLLAFPPRGDRVHRSKCLSFLIILEVLIAGVAGITWWSFRASEDERASFCSGNWESERYDE